MSNGQRLAIFAGVVVVAIVGIIIASGSKTSTSAPNSAEVTIDVKNAKPVGGIKKIELENHKQQIAALTVEP